MATTQYIGSRYVPILADPVEWSNTKEYEPLTIVMHEGNSYTSRQFVPKGIDITNEQFWAITGNYNAQVELYRQETAQSVATNKAYMDASVAENKEYMDSAVETVDAWLEDAQGKYARKMFVFDTVEQMRANYTLLYSGAFCKTNGFYAAGDGGGALYVITENGTANEMDVITCVNWFANLIVCDTFITPDMFGAVYQSTCNIAAFTYAINYAIEHNKDVKLASDFNLMFVSGSTVANPTRILIQNASNLKIDGCNHVVTMKGLTKDYLESIDDISSSGRDIFTLFAFHNCSDITVEHLSIKGENAQDATNKFRYQSPRSIGIAFKHCENCNVDDVHGYDILGNVVNATTDDSLANGCKHINVSNCTAKNTYENGFNFMGATAESMICNCVSERCGNGFEIYGRGCIVDGCISVNSYSYGIAISGGAMAINCVILASQSDEATRGIGLAITEGDNCKAINCIVEDCVGFGLNIFPNATNALVKNCKFKNNSLEHPYGVTFNCQGTATVKMQNLTLQDNYIYSDAAADKFLANFGNNSGLKIIGNTIEFPNRSTFVIALASTTDNTRVCNNYLSSIVNVGSSTNYFVGQNVVNNTIPNAQAN